MTGDADAAAEPSTRAGAPGEGGGEPGEREPGTPGRVAWALLAFAALALLLVDLGGLDLWAPDEPRYAQVAEEMRQAEHGREDLVLLRLAGEPYTQKPPLYFWLAAGLGEIEGGVSPWSARLPSALAGLLTLAVWARIGARLAPRSSVGWWTAALLLTSFRFAHFARRGQLDVLLTCFESLSLLGFLLWRDAGSPHARRRALALLHGATALALLTKGPVGMLPWACFVAVLASEGRARAIPRLFPVWGVALATAPILIWIGAAVALAPSGFFHEAVIDNVWARFAAGTDHVRPLTYFFGQLPIEALPWSLLWPLAAITAWRADHTQASQTAHDAVTRRLLVAWVAIPFVFFTLSAGKRGLYLLPTLPALALALALWIDRLRDEPARRDRVCGRTPPLLLAGVIGVAAAVALPFAPEATSARAAFDAAVAGAFAIGSLGAACGLVLARPGARDLAGLPAGAVVAWGTIVLVFALLFFGVLPELEPEKSPRPIARAIAEATPAGGTIGLFEQRTLLGGLLFYLQDLESNDHGAEDFEPGDRGSDADATRFAGHRALLPIEGVPALSRFVAGGGRVVVARAREASRVEAALAPWGTAHLFTTVRTGGRAQSVWVLRATDEDAKPAGAAGPGRVDAAGSPPSDGA